MFTMISRKFTENVLYPIFHVALFDKYRIRGRLAELPCLLCLHKLYVLQCIGIGDDGDQNRGAVRFGHVGVVLRMDRCDWE